MRLHIGVVGAKERLGARDGRALDDVHELAAAVVAAPGITLGVLIGEDRPRRFENRAADEVFGGDELEAAILASPLVPDGLRDFGIGFGERSKDLNCFCWHGHPAYMEPSRRSAALIWSMRL